MFLDKKLKGGNKTITNFFGHVRKNCNNKSCCVCNGNLVFDLDLEGQLKNSKENFHFENF